MIIDANIGASARKCFSSKEPRWPSANHCTERLFSVGDDHSAQNKS
jgi:hypothetical protein